MFLMKSSAKPLFGLLALVAVFAKLVIVDVWQGSGYASEIYETISILHAKVAILSVLSVT